jgi:Lamin Tail Domain/CHU_C Type IX secretion signal domain/Bacterial Ig-like domain
MKFLPLLCLLFLLTHVLSAQNRYDVVIDEIMVDPSPLVGLPNNEWIELKNISAAPINLQGWRIGDSGGQSGAMPSFILAPNSFVIVCTGSAVAALSAFGNTISVTSFPSLDNDGESLLLKTPTDQIIHAVSYSSSWYQNELKKEGGWTLEMIDTNNPCAGRSNWKASNNTAGGTPGTINSINGVNNDQSSPQLKSAYSTDNTTIVLVFDEPVDSLSGASVSNYTVDGGISFISAEPLSPLFNQVQLKTNNVLTANTVYTITANNITDCKGNTIGTANKAKVGLAVDAAASDVIVNEILFNPRSTAYDYVEFYNRSNKILDASKLYIATRSSSGVISSITPLNNIPFYIFPNDYIVVTEDADNLSLNYLVEKAESVLTPSTLPSFPDDEGFVLLLNQQGAVVDEVNYSDDWHFKLIDNAEGVSLERIDADGPSQEAANWHSAASTAGYGTPGYKNSQFKNLQSIAATIDVTPKVFSPDNDGFNDIATIQYKIDQPGYVANVTIFNAAGRPIRNLVRNGVLSTAGYWNWDGLDDKGLKLPIGTYIVFTEIFNLQGKKDKLKNAVVLARKIN